MFCPWQRGLKGSLALKQEYIKFSRHFESGLLEQSIEERSDVNWSGVEWSGVESSVLERSAVFLCREE